MSQGGAVIEQKEVQEIQLEYRIVKSTNKDLYFQIEVGKGGFIGTITGGGDNRRGGTDPFEIHSFNGTSGVTMKLVNQNQPYRGLTIGLEGSPRTITLNIELKYGNSEEFGFIKLIQSEYDELDKFLWETCMINLKPINKPTQMRLALEA